MAYQQRRMIYKAQDEPIKQEVVQEVHCHANGKRDKREKLNMDGEIEDFNKYLTRMWNLRTGAICKHWTTCGCNFQTVHELYDEIACWAAECIDCVAENLIANFIEFTINTAEIDTIDSRVGEETWKELLMEEFGWLMKTKTCIEGAVIVADECELTGLKSILEQQMSELDLIIYKIRRICEI